MLVVIAMGGSALFRPGERLTVDSQRVSVRAAAKALAPIASAHQLVVAVGSGPQVGLLALQGAAYARVEACPSDVLGAQTEGMIDYLIEQELGNLLPIDRPVASVLTMVEVDRDDPAFRNPTTFIGPICLRDEAEHLSARKGWAFKPVGDKWRRVVASPEPRRTVELRTIKCLLEQRTVVIAAGGGGIPTACAHKTSGRFSGVDCVIDKDLAAALLARELGADLFVMLTDADAVYADWGRPAQRAIRRATPAALAQMSFAAGSMRPKVEAACRFAGPTGRPAAIGTVGDLDRILAGCAGTTVSMTEPGISYAMAADPADVVVPAAVVKSGTPRTDARAELR
jgi:carbamate kinase